MRSGSRKDSRKLTEAKQVLGDDKAAVAADAKLRIKSEKVDA